jgi:hypothetical protein
MSILRGVAMEIYSMHYVQQDDERRVREFLNDRYPANHGIFSKRLIKRGLSALKRQKEGREVGALAREFCL